ncbi:MAG: hypothetical protein KJ697_03080 [Nanoarchaeota archaeon]|nr:hypothetical protein [Nanoarchaeota archaeon]
MVWARTKLVIQDDLINPRTRMVIDFKGKNPQKFYHEIPKLIATSFRVHSDSIQEKKFLMHKGDPEKFEADWEIIKDLDKFSYYRILVSMKGASSGGHGSAGITIEGLLRTEYPQDTYWQKSLFYEIMRMFWHSFFYTSKRQKYLDDGKSLISFFLDDLKNLTRI